MDTFNEAMSKPTDWTEEEIDDIVTQIEKMTNAGRPDLAIESVAFLVSQNQAITGAASDEAKAAYIEKQAIDTATLFQALVDTKKFPDEFLSPLAVRLGARMLHEENQQEPAAEPELTF